MPFLNMAARPGGHPRGGRALSQHEAGTSDSMLPALRPRLAFREAHADRSLEKPASRWARGRETPARDWSRGDDVRRRGATRTRAQSRAFETRRRSVRPGRSLMRSRKVRGPAGGVRATEPHSPRGAGGGRAPLGLELRPGEGWGRGDAHLLPPQARGSRLAPRVKATRTGASPPAVRAAARASWSPRSALRWACCS